jgi:hypothetical protein
MQQDFLKHITGRDSVAAFRASDGGVRVAREGRRRGGRKLYEELRF